MTSSLLFTPVALGDLTLAKRLVVSPMCRYSSASSHPEPWHQQHLGALSISGAGLLMVEATAVAPEGRITPYCLTLHDDAGEAAFRGLVDGLKGFATAKLGLQIAHAGPKASARRPWEGGDPLTAPERGWQTVGPSAHPFAPGWPDPQALDAAGLARTVEQFAQAARRAARIGFDVLELHMAHGYLLHAFFSPVTNRRTDPHGGDLAGRMRLPLEVAAAVRACWPRSGRALGARISGSDWLEDGAGPEDAAELASELRRLGFDYVCVSSGGAAPHARIKAEPGYQLPFARRVRERSGILTRGVGLIFDPAQAEAALREGDCDMVAVGRAFLADPRWGWRAAEALGATPTVPAPYERAVGRRWPGAAGIAGRHL